MDMIAQNVAAEGRADISFTVPRDELPHTLKAVEEAVKELGAEGYDYDDEVSKISDRRPGHGHASPAWPSGCSAPWPRRGSTFS